MLSTTEAQFILNSFNRGILNLVQGEADHGVITKVVATGLYHHISKIFEEAIQPHISNDEPDAGNGAIIPRASDPDDLSDIIDTDEQPTEDGEDDVERAEEPNEEEPGSAE